MNSSAIRDQVIAHDVREVLAAHRAVAAADLVVDVDGGVAHVDGRVASRMQRHLITQVIRRVNGIRAVWEWLRVDGEAEDLVVDLGCGKRKQSPRSIGVDRYAHPTSDVLADIERGLPFTDQSLDQIYAIHVLEHVREIIGVMNEIHRVLKPSGVLHVMVPNWQYVNAVADPTHVRFFHMQTFKFFCRPYPGLRLFRPLSVAYSTEDVFADLQPIKDGEPPSSEQELCRFFD